ncbi:MAG TPA: CHAT domain-containing protein, partial [Ideonella sp.]|nr:CHAT domain-containing protein [Ideonella sp.]
ARGAAAGEALLDVAALQAALGPSRALLAYHLDGEVWRACVVRHDGPQRVEGRLPALNERLLQLRLQLAAMRRPGAAGQRHAPQLLQRARHLLRRFDDDLLAPLRAALGGVRQLVIVPHRGLHALPWAALVDESGHSLLERRELVVAPSATTWLHCHSRALQAGPDGGTALLVGAGGPTLPAVAQEIAAVHAAIGPQARLLQGEQASIAGFLAHAGEAETLHLACHASCRADNPDFSALHFSDGAWTLADASALPLRARLVTLSACDTAVSRVAPGDEVLGLARGFLLAGAHAVVATLWSVEDGSTAELMAAFYRARQRGQAVAAALRQAQLELAARHPHPFFWAPFVAYGHG